MDENIIPNRLSDARDEWNERVKDKKSRGECTEKDIIKTQEYMAEKCGANKATISKYESMKLPVPLRVVLVYADELDVSVDYLLKRSEAAKTENYSAGHELGLTDEAVEVLKNLKEYGEEHPDLKVIEVANAFLGSDAVINVFENIFNSLYEISKAKQNAYSYDTVKDSHEAIILTIIKKHIDTVVYPALKNVIEKYERDPDSF